MLRNRKFKLLLDVFGVAIPLFVIFLFGFWLNSGPKGSADEISGASYFVDQFTNTASRKFADNIIPFLKKDQRMVKPADSKCPIMQTLVDRVVAQSMTTVFGSNYKQLNNKGSVIFEGAIDQRTSSIGFVIQVETKVFASLPSNKDAPTTSQKEWVSSDKINKYEVSNSASSQNETTETFCRFQVNGNL